MKDFTQMVLRLKGRLPSKQVDVLDTVGTQQPDVDKRSWNYGDFCEASKNTDAVIFICKENGKLYFPTEHELFGWKEDPNEEEVL